MAESKDIFDDNDVENNKYKSIRVVCDFCGARLKSCFDKYDETVYVEPCDCETRKVMVELNKTEDELEDVKKSYQNDPAYFNAICQAEELKGILAETRKELDIYKKLVESLEQNAF